MKKLATGIAAIALIGTPVLAAPPPVAPVHSWTGCYIGAQAGYGWRRTSYATYPISTTTGPAQGAFAGSFTGALQDTVNSGGLVSGGQAGCDYQFDPNWVVGVAVDVDGADISKQQTASVSGTGLFNPGGPLEPIPAQTVGTFSTRVNFLSTFTGRIGYAWGGDNLFYAKGGLAIAHSTFSLAGQQTLTACNTFVFAPPPGGCIAFSPPGVTTFSGSTSLTEAGWTVGGGYERSLGSNWSAKIEYNYLGFGNHGWTLVSSGGPIGVSEKQHIQDVIVGLNYRFH